MDDLENEVKDYTCCFCLNILTDPITLKCKHSYCKECLKEYLSYLQLDKVHLEKKKVKRIKIKCPTCRAEHSMNIDKIEEQVNKSLIKKICEKFEKTYKEREDTVKKEKVIEKKKNKFLRRLAIGNSYKEIKDPRQSRSSRSHVNKHKWTFFVRIEGEPKPEKYIQKVYIELHPTFGQNKIWKRKPNANGSYEISRIGWGTFDIPVTIYWKKNLNLKPYTITHELVFDGSGSYHHYDYEIKKNEKKKNGK